MLLSIDSHLYALLLTFFSRYYYHEDAAVDNQLKHFKPPAAIVRPLHHRSFDWELQDQHKLWQQMWLLVPIKMAKCVGRRWVTLSSSMETLQLELLSDWRINSTKRCRPKSTSSYYAVYLHSTYCEFQNRWSMNDYTTNAKSEFQIKVGKLSKHDILYDILRRCLPKLWNCDWQYPSQRSGLGVGSHW